MGKTLLYKQQGYITMGGISKGRAGMSGTKMRISLAIPTGAKLACADHSGAKILNVIAAYRISGVLNRLPTASIGDCILVSVRRGKPELRKKVVPSVIIRQRKPWRRADGIFVHCEDNAAILINPKGEVKGSAITGPITKECANYGQNLPQKLPLCCNYI